MNKLDIEQVEFIKKKLDEFTKTMEKIINKQVEIKINEILKENYIINAKKENPKDELVNNFFEDLFSAIEKNKVETNHDKKIKKYPDEFRGQKVFKRLQEIELSHQDMIKFKKSKVPLNVIAKMLNLGEKTVRGYYHNYPEGKK